MIITLDIPSSTSPVMAYSMCIYAETKPMYIHEARPTQYSIISEKKSSKMLLEYAQLSFKNDWDISDQEENDYWASL